MIIPSYVLGHRRLDFFAFFMFGSCLTLPGSTFSLTEVCCFTCACIQTVMNKDSERKQNSPHLLNQEEQVGPWSLSMGSCNTAQWLGWSRHLQNEVELEKAFTPVPQPISLSPPSPQGWGR